MLWAYDCPGIKGEHMKLNPFIKETTGSGEAKGDERVGVGGRPAQEDWGVTRSNAVACVEGQLSSQPL